MRFPKIELPAVAAILALTLGSVAYPLRDTDFFWHLRTGYLILESGAIPTQDPYSFTAHGAPWEVQGWLFDLAMAWIHRSCGDTGLRLFFSLWIVAVFSVVHRIVRLYVTDTSRALLLTLCSAAGALIYFVPRPLAATLFGFALTLFLLLKHRRTGNRAWLLGIPLAMVVWVNLHFGFVTGLGLVGLVFVGDLMSRAMPIEGALVERGRLTPLLFVAVVLSSLLAVGANPAGYGVLATTAEMTRLSAGSLVIEWQSPDFHLPGPLLFLVPVALAILAHVLGRRRPDWLDLILLFAMTGGALYSMRHMPLAAIALAAVLARGFSGWGALPWSNRWVAILPEALRKRGGEDLGDRAYVLNLMLGAVGVIVILAGRSWISEREQVQMRRHLPVQATDFLEANKVPGPILNEYATGGYLIWRLHPAQKVFIDGRYTPYPARVVDDYLGIVSLREGWLDRLDHYGIRTILLNAPSAGLAQAMVASGRFRMVYQDEGFGVLVRSEPAQAGKQGAVQAPEPSSPGASEDRQGQAQGNCAGC